MKICILSQEYPPETGGGGIGTQSWLKAHGLSKRGHEVHVVSASWDRQARTYKDGLATIHRVPEPDLGGLGQMQSTYWLALSMALAQQVQTLSRDVRFDIMQFPEYAGEGFVYQTDAFAHRTAKFVVQLHGPLAMFAEHMGWPDVGGTLHQIGCFMERAVIHHSDRVMASSHNTARFCARHYGYPLEQIRVIHSGIDTDRFSPRTSDSDDPHPRVLFVGNLVGSKGFAITVNAVVALRKRFPGIRLHAIGKGDADYLRRIMKQVDDAGASANVRIIGYVPYADLPKHYAWCDLMCGPSTHEPGPGNVYLEAMSCARPVIACNTAGAPEVVLDGETGLLVGPQDQPAVEAAIERLAGDEPLRNRLGAAGRAWVEREFSFDRYTDKVERIYKELL